MCKPPTNQPLVKRNSVAEFFNRHQIDLPWKIILPIVVGHLLGLEVCSSFIFISGKLSNGLYRKCLWDLAFLFFYFCVFTLMRAATMRYVLKPLSNKLKVSKGKVVRFCEQSWLVIYYSISFISGFVIFHNSPTWDDTSYFWRGYPDWQMKASLKYYYLLQFAFWIQQPFVLQIEAPRKDYREYMLHHINTLLLVSLSYACNFTAVGVAVFVCMDLPDVLLSLAKTLHYLKFGFICDATFVAMVISWLYTRVYYYGRIIWSTYTETEVYIPEFKLDPINGYWFPHFVKYIILALMLGLYILIIFWTVMIFKVVYKLVTHTGITDVRSDDEDDYDMEDDVENTLEQEVTENKSAVPNYGLLAPPAPKKKRRLSKTEQIRNYAARR